MTHDFATRKPSLAGVSAIRQIAYVVPDIQAAMAWWSGALGIGPFFLAPTSRQTDVRYRGEPASIDFSMALSYCGDMQVELIQPNNDAPSIYREALESGQRGLHHLCVYTDDMAGTRDCIAAAGGAIIHEGRLPGGELLYADLNGGPGAPLYEVLQPPAWLLDLFARLKAATREWDGRDPVRSFG
jgi:methylmalonyl-CoA/ethylmalonyl-CoA epimerase